MRASLVAVLIAATLASCTSSSTGEAPSASSPSAGTFSPIPGASPVSQPISDYASLFNGLAEAGVTVRHRERARTNLFAVPEQGMLLDGVGVDVYEFPNRKTLYQARSSISPDGYSLETPSGGIAIVEWVAPPHFYAAGRLLVVYLGDDQATLRALNLILGPQFAGG